MHFQDILTPQREASLWATTLLVTISLGTLALIALVFVALWLLVELAQLLLTATVEACNTIGATYASADPLIKFLLLVALGFVVYRAGQRLLRRA